MTLSLVTTVAPSAGKIIKYDLGVLEEVKNYIHYKMVYYTLYLR